MALTEAQKREIFAGIHKRLGGPSKPKSRYEKGWWRNFAEEFINEAITSPYSPTRAPLMMMKGAVEEDPYAFGEGALDVGLGFAVPGGIGAAKGLGRKALPKLKKLKESISSRLPKLIGDETGTFGDVIGAKIGRAKKLIEESGGSEIKVDDNNIATWIDAAGKKRTADLNERFGARQLGLSARQTGTNIREKFAAPRDKLLNPRMTEQGKLYRTTAEAKRAREIEEAAKKGVKLGELPSLKGERGSFTFGGGKKRTPTGEEIAKLVEAEQQGLINQAADESLEDYVERFLRENPSVRREIEAPHPQANISTAVRTQLEADRRYDLAKATKPPSAGIPAKFRGKEEPHFPIEEYGEGFEYPVKAPTGKIVATKDKSKWNVNVEENEDGDVVFWLEGERTAERPFGEAGGSLSFHPSTDGKTLEVGVVGLDPNTQGRGVGTALYQEASRWAKSRGYEGISSDPAMRNKRSSGLWEKIKTGTEYYPWGGEKDVKMYGGLPIANEQLSKYVLGPMRTLMSMGEFSAPLRQGMKTMKTHPIRGAQAIKDMFRAARSEKGMAAVDRETTRRLRRARIDPEKVGLAIRDTGLLQQFGNDPLRNLPLISHSERGYEGFMKSLRSRRAVDLIKPTMPTRHKVRLADLINAQTGFGRLGRYKGQKAGRPSFGWLEEGADEMADWIYSPRYFSSRAQQLNPLNLLPGGISRYGRMDNPAYREHLKDTLKDVAITGGALYGLDKSGLADVGMDIRSTQFLKPKFGDTTVDITGGMGSLLSRAGQLVTGEQSFDDKISAKDRWSTTGRTLRTLLAPGPSMAVDFINEKSFMGEPIDQPIDAFDFLPDVIEKPIESIPYGAEILEHTSPMWWGDVVDTARRSTLPPLAQAGIGAAGFFGASGRTDRPVALEPKKKKGKKKKEAPAGLF